MITIVSPGELVPGKEVFKLREHVTCVDHRVGDAPPKLDHLHEGAGRNKKVEGSHVKLQCIGGINYPISFHRPPSLDPNCPTRKNTTGLELPARLVPKRRKLSDPNGLTGQDILEQSPHRWSRSWFRRARRVSGASSLPPRHEFSPVNDPSGEPPDALAAATCIVVSMSKRSAVRKASSSNFGHAIGSVELETGASVRMKGRSNLHRERVRIRIFPWTGVSGEGPRRVARL